MPWRLGWQGIVVAVVTFGIGLLLGSQRSATEPPHSTVEERLQPAVNAPNESASGGTIYVPVYSTLSLGVATRANTVDLAATVSVRNINTAHPITLEWVRYYDSVGRHIRDYLNKPSTLPAMASVEFVVQRSDTTGGPGANLKR